MYPTPDRAQSAAGGLLTVREAVFLLLRATNAPFNRKHPIFPVTPIQMADACAEAAKAGAAGREPDGGAVLI
jgi:hypothetical protein